MYKNSVQHQHYHQFLQENTNFYMVTRVSACGDHAYLRDAQVVFILHSVDSDGKTHHNQGMHSPDCVYSALS